MPQAAAASARDDPSSTWAIAKTRQATRLSWLRDASRRSSCADSSSRVTSILRPIMSSVSSCRPATENLTLQQMGTSKSYKSQEYRRLVLGDGNASTLTYNFGGAAAGLDYRFDPRFLVGIGTGYTHGTQWVNSFMGQGWSDSVSVAAYGSFTQAGFYLDALAGYAYFNNQLQRQILIPGLQQRTATGSTGANQLLGQVESGYKLGIYAPASATITPFGRLQVSSVTQNAFSESGAQSLSLNVAQQTTNSLRTTIGTDLAGSIGLGEEKKVDLAI